MRFEDFISLGNVRRASKDKGLIKSLIEKSKEDLEFFNDLSVSKKSARKLMSNYYDILRSILEAIASVDGYKIYSHEAFTYFLKEVKKEGSISLKFDRFRKIRNSISYYGKEISIEEAEENIEEIKKMIDILMKRYLGEYDG